MKIAISQIKIVSIGARNTDFVRTREKRELIYMVHKYKAQLWMSVPPFESRSLRKMNLR
jgi:hypothetical protein